MENRAIFFGLFSVAALTGAVVACTTTTIENVPAPAADGGGGEGGTSTKDSGGGGGSQDSGGAATGDEACGEEATKLDCATCCANNHKTGYATFVAALVGCACEGTGIDGGADGGGGACATECADGLCADPPANGTTACQTCAQKSIGTGGVCQEHVSKECTADDDCVAQQKCVAQCQNLK